MSEISTLRKVQSVNLEKFNELLDFNKRPRDTLAGFAAFGLMSTAAFLCDYENSDDAPERVASDLDHTLVAATCFLLAYCSAS